MAGKSTICVGFPQLSTFISYRIFTWHLKNNHRLVQSCRLRMSTLVAAINGVPPGIMMPWLSIFKLGWKMVNLEIGGEYHLDNDHPVFKFLGIFFRGYYKMVSPNETVQGFINPGLTWNSVAILIFGDIPLTSWTRNAQNFEDWPWWFLELA